MRVSFVTSYISVPKLVKHSSIGSKHCTVANKLVFAIAASKILKYSSAHICFITPLE